MASAIPYESLSIPRKLLVAVCFCVCLNYLVWRLNTFNTDAPVFSAILYGAEIFGFVMMTIHYMTVWRMSVRKPLPPMPGRSVDVFITTINESLVTVRRTALAALAMDYPHKVWILDDGRRAEMQALAHELGCGYLTRQGNKFAKAGNLNSALPKTHGEFIAFFDADHAPKKNFLTQTLGYFADTNVAFVQTPQDFYNLDSYQHRLDRSRGRIWMEQSLFFRVIQRGKDAWNASFFCGSCGVMRRSALEKIGGFAEGSAAEDLHTSMRLHKAGYDSVYHDESLAFGIAAAQLGTHFKQRMRWAQSSMQIWRKENVIFCRDLTFMQRVLYLSSIITFFTGWQKLIFYVTPALVLLSGISPIAANSTEFFMHFVPFYCISLFTFLATSRGFGSAWYYEQYTMTAFAGWVWATLWYFRKKTNFIVTSKHIAALPDYWRFLMPQMALIALSLTAMAVGTWRFMYETPDPVGSTFAANMFWAGYAVLFAVLAIRFAVSRAGFKRNDYRFHVPLVAVFKDESGTEYHGTVRDISGTGLGLYVTAPAGIKAGAKLTGAIWLSDGALPFNAIVRATGGEGRRIGATFVWKNMQDCYRLERFLYGTDHEWRIHNIDDRRPAFIERVAAFLRRPYARSVAAVKHSMLYTTASHPAAAPQPGIIALASPQAPARVMVFTPLPRDTSLETRVFTESGWRTFKARVANENTVDIDGESLYHYDLEEAHA